jgi:hypothetical protein
LGFSLQPRPVLLLKLKLLAQAQGFGHHPPSLPSAKLLALPANGQRGSPLLAVGQFPPANSLPLALSQAGPYYAQVRVRQPNTEAFKSYPVATFQAHLY